MYNKQTESLTNVKRCTETIKNVYTISQPDRKVTLIEYIEYTDKTDKGYRVESKALFGETIKRMNDYLELELISVHPTLDRTVIATYHFKAQN